QGTERFGSATGRPPPPVRLTPVRLTPPTVSVVDHPAAVAEGARPRFGRTRAPAGLDNQDLPGWAAADQSAQALTFSISSRGWSPTGLTLRRVTPAAL
ncbi:MAG: hypothetical protein QOG64_2411, partial [Acidimicrobiaceae bacterium]|nr:hypothetical protein [Acidimicrobiaceae bacterium]